MQVLLNFIKSTILSILLLLFFSCSEKSKFEFDIVAPKNVLIRKDSTFQFYLKIINFDNKNLSFTNIKSSCQCIILSKRKLNISPKSEDSIHIELFGARLGKNNENLVFTNDNIKKFKIVNINYEVIP